MNEHEYNLVLKNCETLLKNGKTNEALKELQKAYGIKPVRLFWYIVNAKYYWKSQGILQFEYLSDKSWQLYLYPGIEKLANLYMNMVQSYGDIPDVQRHKLFLMSLQGKTKEDEKWIKEIEKRFQQTKIEFLKKPESETICRQLFDLYFIFHNNILLLMLNIYMKSKMFSIPSDREWFFNFSNSGFLIENMTKETEIPFILIEDEMSDGLDEEIIVFILRYLRKKLYYIKSPIEIETEQEIEIKDTTIVSINNMEIKDSFYTIYPAAIICNGKYKGDNREYIIYSLEQNELKNQCTIILTSGVMMDSLCRENILKRNLERLSGFISPVLEKQMVFGWSGDYLSYISQVHDTKVIDLLNAPSEVKYSIVVPARNSSSTLRYTLLTCLNQRYTKDYEIVLSDNSTSGNTEVYQLYKELNDPRIKYYRTPREYNLSRSFEFAFLHAKGDFILSLGSDDALLPWTLETLDNVRKHYPNEDIIQWERGFYAWPGFNGGQQNQFVIPRKYEKGEFHSEYVSRKNYFASILSNSDKMYLLPNLYLNSGCKREYLKTILAKTGRLFDGICQDIYMGVVNAAINDKILNIRYPLIIAGMASGSMGAKANMVYSLSEEETVFLNDLKKTSNLGGYCASLYERLMPEVTTDKSSLYNCILRMIARGVFPESDLDYINFRRWFVDVYRQMDIRDPLFDKKIHYFRYTASLHGDEFLKWFDDNIYYNALKPRFIDEKKFAELHEKKSYTEGEDSFGVRTFDASKYNVHNIYEAAKLFEKLTNL